MADEMNKEREAFEAWARDDFYSGFADIAGDRLDTSYRDMAHHMAWYAYQAGRASLAASAGSEPVAWPKDAADVREFVGSHFRSLFYANPTGMDPHENDVYELTAHDLLSAFRWWAELYPSPPEGAGWRPIETAPKDGTWIELWRTPTDFGRMSPFVIARWESAESMFVWPEFCDPFTKYGRDKADADIAEGDCYGSDDFTHWRALSSPPASEAKGA